MRPLLAGSSSDTSTTKWHQFSDTFPHIDAHRTTLMESLPPPAVSQSSTYSRNYSTRLKSMWFGFTRRLRADVPLSSSNPDHEEQGRCEDLEEEWKETTENGRTERVVVEQSWATGRSGKQFNSSESSDPDLVTEVKSGATPPVLLVVQDKESAVTRHGFWTRSNFLVRIRYRIWPVIAEFFFPRPFEGHAEEQFRNEDWQSKKKLALIASLWFLLSWGLGLWLVPRPFTLLDKIFYYGLGPAFSFPVPFMVMYDWPKARNGIFFYQCYLGLTVWIWALQIILVMYACGIYSTSHQLFSCPSSRDFIGTFYYTTAPPTIGLFAMKMNRLTATAGATCFLVISCALIVPDRNTWIRSMVNFGVFHAVLLYVHNAIETNERRMFSLRVQVKMQFKATQRAQVNERKTAESKYRLTSYVFHEVRVPLNAALLAVQNIEASGTVSKEVDIEFDALVGSLRMMSQVLNDVLDFNKMDGGQFELVNRPYVFHQAMRSMFIPLRMTTAAKRLKFVANLDPNIDTVARRAAYQAMGEEEDAIARHLLEHPDVDGVVIGDEARFRQIVTNLASNACKFTSEGGTVSISTRLILPSIGPDGLPIHDDSKDTMAAQLSASRLVQHNINHAKDRTSPPPTILVRIEVSDTGCGIEQSELTRGKLFSAFNQTEKGRQQGGKGTGLGLALVRNIVKLSGGRLGVCSQAGKGSTFWVELPLGVGRQALIPSGSNVDSVSEPGSMGSDLVKIRTAAIHNESPPALSHNTLTMAVDAAALSASELSSMAKPSSVTHSTLMEQGGSIDLVLRRQESLSSGTMSLMKERSGSSSGSPLPTPATEKSAASSRLMDSMSVSDSPAHTICELDNLAKSASSRNGDSDVKHVSDPSCPLQTLPAVNHTGRPNYIPLPHGYHSIEASLSSSSLGGTAHSSMLHFDRAFDRTSSSTTPPSIEFDPGLPVLVVDDDKVTRMMMARMLTRLGCHVSVAENGEVALKTILDAQFTPSLMKSIFFENQSGVFYETGDETSQPPESPVVDNGPLAKFAVVFLDNQMPLLSGIRTVEILRKMGRKDYVIGLTGNALLPDQEEYLKAGVDAVLTKPVLEPSIKNILKQADLRRKRHSRPSPAAS
ncbi:hypothetical protein E1B28_007772 [Marasmius oreades]|uniref:histidine kinase n=1 Tax=Marasmius oreades TaxID=181124 RepID=A0A9P7S3Q6_9AGAR|nr:uncharacterized protein E1B28_007772 [Marasmius oreades]KAG7094161.1 hypothetical protein E1B28_007772 [Marasmius oreades]